MNPDERGAYPTDLARPTIEYRSPDGSAFSHLLLAAVDLAAPRRAWLGRRPASWPPGSRSSADTSPGGARDARELPGIGGGRGAQPARAPRVLRGAAACRRRLDRLRRSAELEAEADEGLAARLPQLPAAERLAESRRLMHKDLHKH